MDIQMATLELLTATKTNFTVRKEELVSKEGLKTDSYGIFRNDNDKWLGTVGKQYAIFQNHQMAETVIQASLDISEKYTGGTFQDGRKTYYQAKINDQIVGNDTLKRYVTILNSHDGTSSTGFGMSNTVVSCQNTFYMAMKDVSKFRHSISATERIRQTQLQINEMLRQESGLMDRFQKMADTKITKKAIELVVADLFKLKDDDFQKNLKDFSTRKVNEMKRFDNILKNELASHGETMWGLFNAVTWKTNHDDADPKKQTENVMIGGGYSKNQNAFKIINMQLV